MPLSEADRRLLRALQEDSTRSLKDLAAAAGMSSSTLWRRIQEFEAEGLIRKRVTLLDPEKAGLEVCVLLNVNISNQDRDAREAFERFVAKHDEILQCFAVTGSHDYTLVVRTRSVAAYERFLMDELLAHPAVASSETHLVLRQPKNATALPV
jgi:Transcriptional regulators